MSIHVRGGGGASGNATVGDVLKSKSFSNDNDIDLVGTLELTGTASANDVLNGKTFYNTNAKSKITGKFKISQMHAFVYNGGNNLTYSNVVTGSGIEKNYIITNAFRGVNASRDGRTTTLQGSNDQSNWTTIASYKSPTGVNAQGGSKQGTFNTPYKYYRISINSGTYGAYDLTVGTGVVW